MIKIVIIYGTELLISMIKNTQLAEIQLKMDKFVTILRVFPVLISSRGLISINVIYIIVNIEL